MEGQPPAILRAIKRLITRKSFSEPDFIFNIFLKQKDRKSEERILIDVGAHYGISMLKFAKSGWKVFCFEPDDKNRAVLEKTILKNGLKNVVVESRAVSDANGRAKYYSSDISSGISSLLKFHPSHKEAKEVEITALSSYCNEHKIGHIDFLKIDTEGNDLKVIEGLDLKNNRPKIILCEYEDSKTRLIGYSKENMISCLEVNGYRCLISEWYPIVEYGTRHRWRKLTDDITLVADNSWGNIIAAEPDFHILLLNAIKKSFAFRKNIYLTGKYV
jgi:FkbM family methyltransferase